MCFGKLFNPVEENSFSNPTQAKQHLGLCGAPEKDTLKRRIGRCNDLLSTRQFRRLRARPGCKGIANRIHI